MPSWNIHTAIVERLFAEHEPGDLGIADVNAFLFGNYIPDIYVGFMVPDASFRIDYCITHLAKPCAIPLPNPDLFWDVYVARHRVRSPLQVSLNLGTWTHLLADRLYNGTFREFWSEKGVPPSDKQREHKQADFDLFGRSLDISLVADPTPELVEAAGHYRPYRIAPEDVRRTVDAASAIVAANAEPVPADRRYNLLDDAWMTGVLDECVSVAGTWLSAWRELAAQDLPCFSANIQAATGMPPISPDDPDWQTMPFGL